MDIWRRRGIAYLGVEIEKNCPWDAHNDGVIEKGKAQMGKIKRSTPGY